MLDTDTCVELLRGNQRVIATRGSCRQPVYISFVTAAELYYGAECSADPSGNQTMVKQFLAEFDMLGLDHAVVRTFGQVKQLLQAKGAGLADLDLLIASTALTCKAILVTGNRRHYERVPGLVIEDWIR